MKIRKSVVAGVLALALGNAQATLFDRGGGLIYDDVLNVTWLQDANYAKTSGYDADGRMSWSAAMNWAANLSFHDTVRNVDYADWRLAENHPIGNDWNYSLSNNDFFNGLSDFGTNITSPKSEMSYMYYVNLGLKSANYSPEGHYLSSNFTIGTVDGQKDVGLIRNLQAYLYWSGTEYLSGLSPTGHSWYFHPDPGVQAIGDQVLEYHAWAVREGDVATVAAPIPEPETYAMMLAGLGLLGFVRRRKQNG